jgi:hypothetical protein
MAVRLINGKPDKNQYNKPTHNGANCQGTSDKHEHNSTNSTPAIEKIYLL